MLSPELVDQTCRACRATPTTILGEDLCLNGTDLYYGLHHFHPWRYLWQ
jgi:hypothetical protein